MFLYLLKAIRVARTSLYSNSGSKILQFKTAITLLALSFIRSRQQSKRNWQNCSPRHEQHSTRSVTHLQS